MNIFVLDRQHDRNVSYYVKSHITKMPLEYAQLLSTALRVLDYSDRLCDIPCYKSTHINHPCSIWVRQSLAHWLWLKDLSLALGREFYYRRNKVHASCELVLQLPTPINFKDVDWLCDPPQAMPIQYQKHDVVNAYRCYYRTEKSHLADWENRAKPYWY